MLSAEANDSGLVSPQRRRFSRNDARVYNGLLNRYLNQARGLSASAVPCWPHYFAEGFGTDGFLRIVSKTG